MNAKSSHWRFGIALLALSLVLCGCGTFQIARRGDAKSESHSVDAGAATSASVLLEMQAGEMSVTDGAQQLMQADFDYDIVGWEPQIDYQVNGSQGQLAVTQPGSVDNVPVGSTVNNRWDIQLNGDMPLDLVVRTGAGEGILDLSGLDLSKLQVDTGAGNTNLDLSGSWGHDLHATVSAGVGNLSVTLPADMGVRVTAAAGLGGVTATGLANRGSTYVNEAYGSAAHTLTLDIQSGVGAIELTVP